MKAKEWIKDFHLNRDNVHIMETTHYNLFWNGGNNYVIIGIFQSELRAYKFNAKNNKSARTLLVRKENMRNTSFVPQGTNFDGHDI